MPPANIGSLTSPGRSAGPGNADGPAAIARFNTPRAIAYDPQGNLLVLDGGNRALRKVTPQGQVSTVLVDGQVNLGPSAAGLACDANGTIYLSDTSTHTIYKISADGAKSVFTGRSYPNYYDRFRLIGQSADGPPDVALFCQPSALAFDRLGNLYVADSGNATIRKITPGGITSTVAGSPGATGTADGVGAQARFSYPHSLVVDAASTIYVGDVTTVRKITPDGTVTTLVGQPGVSGNTDGLGSTAGFFRPYLALDAAGNVLVADSGNHTLRRVTPAGQVTTLAGAAGQPEYADGPADQARFWSPLSLLVDRNGNVLVADADNDCIRQLAPNGTVSTFAGIGGGVGNTDGTGSAARFDQPWGITVDGSGTLYLVGRGNTGVRKINPAGVVTTLGRNPNFYNLLAGASAITQDRAGNLVVAPGLPNTVVKVTPAGAVLDMKDQPVVAGQPVTGGALNTYTYLLGAARHPNGSIYVADAANTKFWIFSPTGELSTLTITSAEVPLQSPNGLAFDATGNLYVADRNANTIDKITPAGALTVFAGAYNEWGHRDGTAREARFGGPCGVAVDAQGNVFVADTGTNTIRQITPAGLVTTIGGRADIYGSADGVGANAHFYTPHALAIGTDGALYVAEEWNHSVRKGLPAAAPSIATQPRSLSAVRGSNVTFTVAVAAVPDATYQWYFNNAPFAGATNASLTLTGIRPEDAGDYTVVATNALGSVTSTRATLTVTETAPTPSTNPGGSGSGGGALADWFVAFVAFVAGALIVRTWLRAS